MNNSMFGLIYTGEANAQLRELTFSRSVAAVPFGGRYRAIDFMLSDIVNTGISNVGIITQRNYHSLMDSPQCAEICHSDREPHSLQHNI